MSNATEKMRSASEEFLMPSDDETVDEQEDEFGNPINGDRLIYCCFPNCGCDGSRLCMAENGASDRACRQNVEGMYQRTDTEARLARWSLVVDVRKEKR